MSQEAGTTESKPRKLGKGLSSLVGLNPAPAVVSPPEPIAGVEASAPTKTLTEQSRAQASNRDQVLSDVYRLLLNFIDPSPFQPRKSLDEAAIAGLAASIKHSGLMQPVIVRRRGERYELVAGERRWRAAQVAGLETIPALVSEAQQRHPHVAIRITAHLGLHEKLVEVVLERIDETLDD